MFSDSNIIEISERKQNFKKNNYFEYWVAILHEIADYSRYMLLGISGQLPFPMITNKLNFVLIWKTK